MYGMLATVQQFSFCDLLRFIIISREHNAFSLSSNAIPQKNGTQTLNRERVKEVSVISQKRTSHKLHVHSSSFAYTLLGNKKMV